MNMSCVQKCAIKAVGQHSCLGQWYASLSLLGSVRSLKVIARDNLQDCGQFNVGRQPAYVPTRPLGPLPAAERTDEPRARTHVSQSRLRACSIEHGFRSTGTVLVEIRPKIGKSAFGGKADLAYFPAQN